jgi:hypothetical protein
MNLDYEMADKMQENELDLMGDAEDEDHSFARLTLT